MTSGLVVLLQQDPSARNSALSAIRDEASFTLGEQEGCWLSVAMETQSALESEVRHDWLRRLPGVDDVEVVFVHMDEAEANHVGA